MTTPSPVVAAVCSRAEHQFSKPTRPSIELVVGEGVVGDAHRGTTVKHRSRVAADPTKPNLRQVHLIHEELFAELAALGFALRPGVVGENVTTRGLDLLALSTGTCLRLGPDAVVEVTGLRNPCKQLNDFQPGLMQACLGVDSTGKVVRKAGVMAVVVAGGIVRPGDPVEVSLPTGRFRPLACV
ncbi:MAG: MOSC domain-containing protein [Pseudomonadota bacterium]